jgi:protein-S-isoprenylcysteine O-methyltransferase Ste14
VASWSKIARRIRVPLGFAFAVLYMWLARPTWRSILIGAVITIPGLVMRAMASGYVQKNEKLATGGPYAYTRNPLYLGSFIMAVGFAVAARNWWVAVVMVVMFLAIYLPVIRGEEVYLREHFPEFDEYASQVPRLLPRLTSFAASRGAFSGALYLKHREYNALVGSLAILGALASKLHWMSN